MRKHDDGGPAKDKSLWAEYAGQALGGPWVLELEREFAGLGAPHQDAADAIADRCGLLADAMIARMRKREEAADKEAFGARHRQIDRELNAPAE